jgi:hypothetical protein
MKCLSWDARDMAAGLASPKAIKESRNVRAAGSLAWRLYAASCYWQRACQVDTPLSYGLRRDGSVVNDGEAAAVRLVLVS